MVGIKHFTCEIQWQRKRKCDENNSALICFSENLCLVDDFISRELKQIEMVCYTKVMIKRVLERKREGESMCVGGKYVCAWFVYL